MFKLSCGFFVKSKEEKSNQERNEISKPGQMNMRKNENINDVILPVPASGKVRFFRYTEASILKYMVVPVGTLMSTYSAAPNERIRGYTVIPDTENPYYCSQSNAYICPPGKPSIDVLSISLPLANGATEVIIGSDGNAAANTIQEVYNYNILNCDGLTNPLPFTNGVTPEYRENVNAFRK